ncbi:hypothetical protein GJ744_000779 [Endocarpon pusillum]|uniref:HECT-type E3 ubiquitin transferase n=1 Tax=Endocarpon pusillum TaxID=364733 RepID=A0A8H7E115_9EURO|nr:hypothetical protein GJ744_000779 [Endocarpon pusillum]
MFQSFTGNSRKPRQVNLSGQNASGRKGLNSTQKPNAASPGSQVAIAQAQAQRLQRGQERERLNASKLLQRSWRGHSSRQRTREAWRAEWDQHELARSPPSSDVASLLRDTLDDGKGALSYESAGACYSQLRLLLHFLDIQQDMDRSRLMYFGGALQKTLEEVPSIATGDSWTMQLYRLSRLTVEALRSVAFEWTSRNAHQSESFLSLLVFLTRLIPKHMARNAERYYRVLAVLLRYGKISTRLEERAAEAVLGLLTPITAETMTAYTAFGTELLTMPDTLVRISADRTVAPKLNYKMLTTALNCAIEEDWETKLWLLRDTQRSLWLLAHLIFLHRHSLGATRNLEVSQEIDHIRLLSALLAAQASEITSRVDVIDESMIDTTRQKDTRSEAMNMMPLPQFIREQILTLIQKTSIVGMMSQIGLTVSSARKTGSDGAQALATYALTLTRVFPGQRADEIRMWLYDGSANLKTSTGTSAILYFWHYSRSTAIFQRISRDHRNAVPLLRSFLGLDESMSAKALQGSQQEWRMLLLFLELYSFAIRIMDDEGFLAGGQFGTASSTQWGGKIRESSLPLEQVRELVIFLKNLAFALYWNSKDLQEGDHLEQPTGLAAYFGNAPPSSPSRIEARPKLTSQDSARVQLRDLVTGLLRSIHQRDSRRKFFSDGFWLMSSQVDMSGFIPAVVAEEERRHEAQDGEEEDDDDDDLAGLDPGDVGGLGLYDAYRAPRNTRHLQMMKEQKRSRRMRQMEAVAPRHEILQNLPFFIPFETRVQIFREFILRDQQRRRGGIIDPDTWRLSIAQARDINPETGQPRGLDILQRHHAKIQRQHIFSSAFDQFNKLGDGLKEPVQITFIDQFGSEEAGIDGGGVTKEFLTSITKETFDPLNEEQLFVANEQNLLYPNPGKLDSYIYLLRAAGMQDKTAEMDAAVKELLARYRFLGRIIGKCLYEGFLIDVSFAGYFLLRWALTGGTTQAAKESGYRPTIDDLRELDEELYQGILKLKHYDGDVEADFGLNFTVVDTFEVPAPTPSNPHNTETKSVTRPLISSGADIPVTNINRPQYISALVNHRLRTQSLFQTNAFLLGLGEIIQPMWLSMFNQSELQRLIGGDSREIDISDLRTNTVYSGLYVLGDNEEEHPTIKLFWDVLRQMDDQDRRKVLKFVTSTPRAPLLGFGHLNPRFSIRDSGAGDEGRLPSTSTCVNLLKLPRYSNARVLREKLLYAVNSGAGFDLS